MKNNEVDLLNTKCVVCEIPLNSSNCIKDKCVSCYGNNDDSVIASTIRGVVHLQDKMNPCNPDDHDWHTSFCDHPEHTTFCFNCERCIKEELQIPNNLCNKCHSTMIDQNGKCLNCKENEPMELRSSNTISRLVTTIDILDEDHLNDKQQCATAFCDVQPTSVRLIIWLLDKSRIYIWLCGEHYLAVPEELKQN